MQTLNMEQKPSCMWYVVCLKEGEAENVESNIELGPHSREYGLNTRGQLSEAGSSGKLTAHATRPLRPFGPILAP